MEQIKKTTKAWWPAWLAAIRYILLVCLTEFGVWLSAVSDRWDSLGTLDWLKLGVSQAVLFLGVLGAVMNDKWSKAKGAQ